MHRLGAALIVILTSIVAASCSVTKVGDGAPETTTFRLTGDKIVISSDLGSLELVPVQPATGPDHDVKITRWFEAEKTAGNAKAEWSKEGDDTIRLGGVCSGVIIECRLRHRIEIPSDLAIEVRAEAGSVVANDFTAPIDIRVSEGNINVEGASGPIALATDSGSMRAERLSSDQVTARADEGYVILEFERPPAEIKTRSTHGNTTIRLPDAGYRIKTVLTEAKSSIKINKDARSRHRIDAKVTEGRLTIERS